MKIRLNIWKVVIIIHPLEWYIIPVACHNADDEGSHPIFSKLFWIQDDWWHTELSIICLTFTITK